MGLSTAIRDPINDLANHTTVLKQLKEAVEVAQRLRGDPGNSYVQASELTGNGSYTMVNGVLVPSTTAAAGAGGAVSITPGTGLATSPNPITGTGSISLANTAVTPGSFTNANITVDAQGRLTAAANGSGGGGGGGGNITADTHPTSPSIWDDEFEASSLDPKWSWVQQNSATAALKSGSLLLTGQITASDIPNAIVQTLPVGDCTFDIKAGVSTSGSQNFCAPLFLLESSSSKILALGIYNGGPMYILDANGTLTTSFTGNPNAPISPAYSHYGSAQNLPSIQGYWRCAIVGTTISFYISSDGISWQLHFSYAVPTYFTTAPDRIGLCVRSENGSTPAVMSVDWFRRTA